MPIMIVKESSIDGESEYELNRENIKKIISRTGLDEPTIYTRLSSGRPLDGGDIRWEMVRQ